MSTDAKPLTAEELTSVRADLERSRAEHPLGLLYPDNRIERLLATIDHERAAAVKLADAMADTFYEESAHAASVEKAATACNFGYGARCAARAIEAGGEREESDDGG
jgi:hypothetical protein